MEALASKSAAGINSAHEAARLLGLPLSSVLSILHGILDLYPYRLLSCHELFQRISYRGKHLRGRLSPKSITSCGLAAYFLLHGDFNTHNCRIWAMSNPREYTQKPLHSPKLIVWCAFTGSFII
ncbi:hypothetical protein AVEN_225216-1 [Araneus ventricosus]|uniref:Uncharacterized protein n=1 Tax=Araneus ventricosus TaxID=182803 RepID=A0A4Y2AMR7_ARAVE|nr:hypothetical protein AVEN_225216-1 [Araneus ventricosus]